MNEISKEDIKNSIINQFVPSESDKKPKKISYDDYKKQMDEVREKDRKLAYSAQREIREKDIQRMYDMLPDRFRMAEASKIPEIQDRIKRLKLGLGIHKTSIGFLGVVGSGKTWAAYGYLLDAVRAGAIYPDQVEIITESVLASISRAGFSKEEKMKELIAPNKRFFIIDDVGQAGFKDESTRNDVWFEVVDHIYRNNLTLVITTNLPVKGESNRLASYLGSAVYSRLMSLTGGDFIVPARFDRRPEVLRQMEDGSYKAH